MIRKEKTKTGLLREQRYRRKRVADLRVKIDHYLESNDYYGKDQKKFKANCRRSDKMIYHLNRLGQIEAALKNK